MKFSMADVFGRTFNIIGKAFVPLIIINILCYIAPYLVMSFGAEQIVGLNMAQPEPNRMAEAWPVLLAVYLVSIFLGLLHVSALTEVAVLQGGGKPIKIGAVLGHGVANVLPLLGIIILCAIGWVIGSLFLLIPGIIFGLIYCVVVPAYVAEKPNFFGAFKRSAFLTKGHRWGIFGMLLLFLVIYYVIMGAVSAPSMISTFTAIANGGTPPAPDIVSVLSITIVGALMTVVFTVFVTSIYLSLRSSKEMISVDSVAKVFE